MPSAHLDHGENGTDEGATCLRAQGPKRMQRYRDWFVGDSQLSHRARVLAWMALALCALLLLVIVVMAASWPPSADPDVCISPECLRVAAEEIQWLNQSSEVCNSPREWSCGGWFAENADQIPARSSWNILDSVKLQELKRLREIFTTASNMQNPDSVEWRLKTLYDSCMAEHIIEEEGSYALSKMILDLGGWHVRRNWNAHSWSWRNSLETLQSRHGVSPLFSVSLVWRHNATALHIRPDGLGLPDPTFYQLSSDSQEVKAYKGLLKDAAISMDASSLEATRFSDDIFSFEKRLADLILGEYELHTETWMTMRDLNDNTVQLPFKSILSSMLPKIGITDDTNILVTSPHYMTYLINVTSGTSPSILNDYFTWTLIRKYLPYMSQTFRLVWKEYQTRIKGSTSVLERWEFCTRLVQDTAPLATQAILENEDPTSNLERKRIQSTVMNMFDVIKSKAREAVVTSKSLESDTKPLMIAQLNGLKLQIGLKPIERTPDFQKEFYKGLLYSQKHDLFRNIAYSLEARLEMLQASFLKRDIAIINEISKSLTETEAAYNKQTNTVIIPMSLVSKPHFSVHYPEAVKFGRIGVTMATAVARAMAAIKQDSGASYPKYSAPTVHCLTSLLSDMLQSGQPVVAATSGYLHILGVQLAMQSVKDSTGSPSALPVLTQLNGGKLFAVTYAQTLCSMNTPQQTRLDAVHSKLNGETMFSTVWPHMRPIQEVFGCSPTEQCPAPI